MEKIVTSHGKTDHRVIKVRDSPQEKNKGKVVRLKMSPDKGLP